MRFTRVVLLLIAAACVAAAILVVYRRGGVAYINLESALRDSRVFYTSIVAPAAVSAACLAAAALPRIVAINLAVAVALVSTLELGARSLVPAAPLVQGEPDAGGSAFYVPDAQLGYVLAPSVTARHRRRIGETQIYDVTYRTDARGRRDTPTTAAGERSSEFLLFFGDSNVFGEGLSQTETLPYFAGAGARGYRPYNYGVPGYGPSHALALARRGGLRTEVEEASGYAIFLVIPAHVGRVVGSSRVSTGWGRHFPYYTENGPGDLVRAGDFTHGRPLTTLAYFLWSKSALAERLGVELPMRYTDEDYRLTARVLRESQRRLAGELRLRGSVVVLAQAYDDAQRRTIADVRGALAREGVPYLDYTRLFDSGDPRYRLAERDYHSSAAANRIIAAQLVSDLLGAPVRIGAAMQGRSP
jgi:hypothetical protein